MLQDLAALAPPAIVCVAFLVGAWVTRAQGTGAKAPRARASRGGTRTRDAETLSTLTTSKAEADISQHLRFI